MRLIPRTSAWSKDKSLSSLWGGAGLAPELVGGGSALTHLSSAAWVLMFIGQSPAR